MNRAMAAVHINSVRAVPEFAPVCDQAAGPVSRAGFVTASASAVSSSATT
jgi:hypothetical protein